MAEQTSSISTTASFPLNRDHFLRTLLRELSSTLEEVIGLEEASGFISVVGQRIGQQLNEGYQDQHGGGKLDIQQVAEALVDLKERIEGGFSIESISPQRIVLRNTQCPFGDYVQGRESLCMMTSNVFGVITADNLGFARITLDETIARGDTGCRIIIDVDHLLEPADDNYREYFPA